MSAAFVGEAPLLRDARQVEGGSSTWTASASTASSNYDAMPPFLMSLVSDSDHWLFISSNGALTAGRRDPDHALFPYYTDDRIHDSQDQTGGKTIAACRRATGGPRCGSPSRSATRVSTASREASTRASRQQDPFRGDQPRPRARLPLRLDDQRTLRLRAARDARQPGRGASRNRPAGRHPEPVAARPHAPLPDGVQHPGRRLQGERSSNRETGLGLFRLSSIPTDRAEPSEALRATTVWSRRPRTRGRLLSRRSSTASGAAQTVRAGDATSAVGAGPTSSAPACRFPKADAKSGSVVADVDQDAADVAATARAS